MRITELLGEFSDKNKFKGKGPLCVALIVTRQARKDGLPLTAEKLLTSSNGQVSGLGKAGVQSILKEYGIERVLAEEGGRMSRGSVGNMKKYVEFLNRLNEDGVPDLEAIELWWVGRVRQFFAGKPFPLRFDTQKSLRSIIRELMEQAEKRQAQSPGYTIVGTMLQHLVGAKLNLLLDEPVEHHGASVADNVSGRDADFFVSDVSIHVTTAPGEALIRKCKRNIESGNKPMIITNSKGVAVALGLAEQGGLQDRVDVFDAEQFIAGNIYELGKFESAGRKDSTMNLIDEYNKIIDKYETDPSLRIEFLK